MQSATTPASVYAGARRGSSSRSRASTDCRSIAPGPCSYSSSSSSSRAAFHALANRCRRPCAALSASVCATSFASASKDSKEAGPCRPCMRATCCASSACETLSGSGCRCAWLPISDTMRPRSSSATRSVSSLRSSAVSRYAHACLDRFSAAPKVGELGRTGLHSSDVRPRATACSSTSEVTRCVGPRSGASGACCGRTKPPWSVPNAPARTASTAAASGAHAAAVEDGAVQRAALRQRALVGVGGALPQRRRRGRRRVTPDRVQVAAAVDAQRRLERVAHEVLALGVGLVGRLAPLPLVQQRVGQLLGIEEPYGRGSGSESSSSSSSSRRSSSASAAAAAAGTPSMRSA